MRTLLLLAVFALSAALTSTADAQWLRARRTSECANGQCGTGAVEQSDSQQAAEPDAPQTQPVEQAAATEPVAESNAAATAPAADPAAPAAASAASSTRSGSVSSARSRTANTVVNGRSWRRLRSRS